MCLDDVHITALACGEAHTQIKLGFYIALLGCFLVPIKSFAQIDRASTPLLHHHGQVKLRFWAAIRCSLGVPADRFCLVDGNPFPVFVDVAQLVTGRQIALQGLHHQALDLLGDLGCGW